MRLDLLREQIVGEIVLGDDQKSARILVDPVDDPRTDDAIDRREPPGAVKEQRVHERAVPVARRGMHDHPLGLVDDQQVVILVDDVDGDVLRDDVERLCVRHLDGELLAAPQPVVLRDRLSVREDGAVVTQPLHDRAGEILRRPGNPAVDPLPRVRLVGGEIALIQRSRPPGLPERAGPFCPCPRGRAARPPAGSSRRPRSSRQS